MTNNVLDIVQISIDHGSLCEKVSEALRNAMFAGTLKPGDFIRERHFAVKLGVSQATVREALLRLEAMGLVVRLKNRATMVTNLSRKEAQERIAIRKRLEGWAAEEAAVHMGPAEFIELERLLFELARAVQQNFYLGMTHGDLEFHRYIWRCSGNTVLYEALNQITAPLFAFVGFLNQGSVAISELVVDAHLKVIEALKSQDGVRIYRAISDHIDLGYEHGQAAHLRYGYE